MDHLGSEALSILLLIALMGLVRQSDAPFLPLLVQEIHGSLTGAGFHTGILCAVGGMSGMLSGFLLGHLTDRADPPTYYQAFRRLCGTVDDFTGIGAQFRAAFCGAIWYVFLCRRAGSRVPDLAGKGDSRETMRQNLRLGGHSQVNRLDSCSLGQWYGGIRIRRATNPLHYIGTPLFLLLVPCIHEAVRRVNANRVSRETQ